MENILDFNIKFFYNHIDSRSSKGIQAIDMFLAGVFSKYNLRDKEWFECYSDKVKVVKEYSFK